MLNDLIQQGLPDLKRHLGDHYIDVKQPIASKKPGKCWFQLAEGPYGI